MIVILLPSLHPTLEASHYGRLVSVKRNIGSTQIDQILPTHLPHARPLMKSDTRVESFPRDGQDLDPLSAPQRYRQRLHFEIKMKGKEFLVNLLSSKSTTRLYLADQIFDDQRDDLPIVLVWFRVDDGVYDEVIQSLALHGFYWKGDRYFYFTAKEIGKFKTFFCRQVDETIQNSFSLWNKVISFQNLKSIPLIGMRLSLLVSSSCPGFTYLQSSGIEVTILPDIYDSERTYLWTEGSGFISSELAREHLFPRHVTHGIPFRPLLTSPFIEEPNTESLAIAYQVRFLCSHGLFKGTLIVDPFLKGRQILLRESMRKAYAPDHPTFDLSVLSIVNTPPLPSRCESICCDMSHEGCEERNNHQSRSSVRKCCGCVLPTGHLNRHLILILNESHGVPLKTFQELARLISLFFFLKCVPGSHSCILKKFAKIAVLR